MTQFKIPNCVHYMAWCLLWRPRPPCLPPDTQPLISTPKGFGGDTELSKPLYYIETVFLVGQKGPDQRDPATRGRSLGCLAGPPPALPGRYKQIENQGKTSFLLIRPLFVNLPGAQVFSWEQTERIPPPTTEICSGVQCRTVLLPPRAPRTGGHCPPAGPPPGPAPPRRGPSCRTRAGSAGETRRFPPLHNNFAIKEYHRISRGEGDAQKSEAYNAVQGAALQPTRPIHRPYSDVIRNC